MNYAILYVGLVWLITLAGAYAKGQDDGRKASKGGEIDEC